ncbi:hypothetical protein QQ045_010174 [Rhodiola kirilowii]
MGPFSFDHSAGLGFYSGTGIERGANLQRTSYVARMEFHVVQQESICLELQDHAVNSSKTT